MAAFWDFCSKNICDKSQFEARVKNQKKQGTIVI
jgi:hypothetical protein